MNTKDQELNQQFQDLLKLTETNLSFEIDDQEDKLKITYSFKLVP